MNNYYMYHHMPRPRRKDNTERAYSFDLWNIKHVMDGHKTLESFLTEIVRKAKEKWINDPFEYDEEFHLLTDEQGNPEFKETIWDKLDLEDSKYPKRHKYNWQIRVPKLVHSNREWDNFYRTFPSIAEDVILGKERFSNGAKLKMTPMMEKILEKEWPKTENHKLNKGQYNHGIMMIEVHKAEHQEYLRKQAEDDAYWEAWYRENNEVAVENISED